MPTGSDGGVAETPTDRCVDDLLDRMTVAEKAAQLGSVNADRILTEDDELDEDAVDEHLSNGIGHLTRVGREESLRKRPPSERTSFRTTPARRLGSWSRKSPMRSV